jgi:alkylhydroperoxidase/carboxymuconolactone decarboxylase family protein YurZ
MSSETFEKGVKVFGDVYGEDMAKGVRHYALEDDGFGHLQAKWAMEWAFGSIWAREELPRKMRSCAVLGMVIALRSYDEIKYHTRMALANGLTREDIQEIYYTSIPYCGLPVSNTAKSAIMEALKEMEAEGKL